MRGILFFFMVFIFSICFLNAQNCDEVKHPDYEALMSLYNSTDGPNWRSLKGWKEGADEISCNPCDFNGSSWFGISCDAEGRVVSLILSSIPLKGLLPKELAQLDNLEKLFLGSNLLNGQIPVELSQLQNLVVLDLSRNELVGQIPKELSRLGKLEHLILRSNQLKGNIPVELSQILNLELLDLEENVLSGCFPEELCILNQDQRRACSFDDINFEGCQYDFRNNEGLPWGGDFGRYCNGENQIGAPCMVIGEEAIINENCECVVQQEVINNSCRERDSLALIALYNATDGLNWTNTWDLNRPIDEWFGIELNEDGCVVIVRLLRNNLFGKIPPEIGELLDVFDLNLQENNLMGLIPTTIGNLTKLIGLQLGTNNLTGSILTELSNLNKLIILDISNNNLFGEIPQLICELSQLEVIYLNNNSLSGQIPDCLANLSEALRLDLSNNSLSGCIPNNLTQLCGLNNQESINCSENIIGLQGCSIKFNGNGNLPWEGDFGRFCNGQEQIGAPCNDGNPQSSNDQINDNCECVGETTQPVECDLIGQTCDDDNFSTFDDKFDENCNCIGFVPTCTNDAEGLYALYQQCGGENWLYYDFETDTPDQTYNWDLSVPLDDWVGVSNIQGCITTVSLFGYNINRINKETGESELQFQRTGVTGEIPDELSNLKYLRFFGISNDSLIGRIPDYFGDFKHLISLNLFDNELSGTIPNSLNKLRNIESLTLSYNELISPIPDLDSLVNLEYLSLNNNLFQQDIPHYICDYDSLKSLNLSYNEFTESPILECLRELETLETLSLNGINAIDGIPDWICDFKYLRSLSLGDNCLNTELLPCIGSIDSLRTLSIYRSKISGTIPSEYCSLAKLRNISLRNNDLKGDFPECFNDFQNLEIISYTNNKLTSAAHIINDIEARQYLIGDNCFVEMPDLTNVTRWTSLGTALNCVNNKLSFEDLLQNAIIFNDSTLNTFYAPQALVYVDTVFQVVNGTEFTINLGFDEVIAGNQYLWLKEDIQVDLIEGSNQFSFDPISWEDEGTYTVQVTNPTLPELTLFSHPIKIEILCNVINTSQNLTICESESVEIGNALFDANNSQGTVTLNTDRGCDSIIEVSLNILVENEILVERTLCENEEQNILGEVFSKDRLSGIIERPGTNGCVERTIVNLSLLENSKSTIDTFICDLSTALSINNQFYEESGSYVQNFPVANQCDSILNILILDAEVGDPCNDLNENTDNDTVQEDCTCLGEPPCIMPDLGEDEFFIRIGFDSIYDVIENDILPLDRDISILSISEHSGSIRLNLQDQLFVSISENLVEDIIIEYEGCDLSCNACSSNFITIKNQLFEDLVKTNAFTPDGDGDNDLLRFTDSDVIEDSELWIYNRWGDQIYKKENYTNDWDGDGYPDGVYYYILKVGETVIKNSLTILR